MFTSFILAWCHSIYKSLRSKATGGKSPFFMVILMIGCIAGIINKLLYRYDEVVYLYIVNTVLIGADLTLYFRNRKLEQRIAEGKADSVDM